MPDPIVGPLPARSVRCVAGSCTRQSIPTWPWCEAHRPRFDRPPPRDYWPPRAEDRAREAIARWPEWEDEALATAASVAVTSLAAFRVRMGISRRYDF